MPASRERLSVRDFFVNGINGTTNLRDLPSDSDGNVLNLQYFLHFAKRKLKVVMLICSVLSLFVYDSIIKRNMRMWQSTSASVLFVRFSFRFFAGSGSDYVDLDNGSISSSFYMGE